MCSDWHSLCYVILSWDLYLIFQHHCCQILLIIALGILIWDSRDLGYWAFILLWDPVESRSSVYSVVRSWVSWFIIFIVCSWILILCCGFQDPGDRGSYFLFSRELLAILGLDFVILSWDPVDHGSRYFVLASGPLDLGIWFLTAANVWIIRFLRWRLDFNLRPHLGDALRQFLLATRYAF